MSSQRIAWQDGEQRVQLWAEKWVAQDPSMRSESLHQSARRQLIRLESRHELSVDPTGETAVRSVVLKIHRTRSGAHPARESIKHAIGYSPALREWQALVELHAARVPVPEPLAWGFLPNGDPVVVTEYFEGRGLAAVLEDAALTHAAKSNERPDMHRDVSAAARQAAANPRNADAEFWIDQLAASVRSLHDAGYRHGDLHLGNLQVVGRRVMLLDVQRARRARNRRDTLRDLAQLDFSLARSGIALELRRRLRQQLGDPPGLDAATRRFLRDFLRGRSRREFRIGANWEVWRPEPDPSSAAGRTGQGLRIHDVDLARLDRVLREAVADPTPGARRAGATRISSHVDGTSSWIVKRTTPSTRRRAVVDRLRGSEALRSFRIGQRLALLGALGARPIAAYQERRSRFDATSWLVLEQVGQIDLDAYRPASTEVALRCATALARWIADWQAWGIDHHDLKAGNIRVEMRDDTFRFWLIDLGDIRFVRRVGDAARLRALVQLNASLADEAFVLDVRRAALDAYLERYPFARLRKPRLLETIARQSRARGHRWQGSGCRAIGASPAASARRSSTP